MEQPKAYYDKRLASLKQERESFISHWKELSSFVRPRTGRFFVQDRNKGTKKYQDIINSRATQAHKIATAGMLAGTISPTRPWFSLQTHDPERMEATGVKDWLFDVESIIRDIFNQSNFYGQASQCYGELLLYGSACMSHINDFENVARFYTHTIGSYCLGLNDRCEVDTMYREFEWSAHQIVKAFGLENVSVQVKNAYDRGDYDKWFTVVHLVEPNDEFKHGASLSRNKLYRSVYYEPGTSGADRDKWLSVSGFDEFPGYAPRWDVIGEDIYGTDCPGMTALGDIRGLQILERRKAQAVDKMVNPPLVGPAAVRNIPVTTLPGGLNLYEGDDQRQELKPLYQVTPQLKDMRVDMDAVEQRIDKAFFVDMFLAISNMEGIQPRNQLDIMQRNEERLLQLGPVLERLQSEFLNPLIDRTFNQAYRAGILPEIPEALANEPLKVKYISTLAQAQQAVATQGIERTAAFVGQMVQMGLVDAADKFDSAQAVDEYNRAIGAPPSIIRDDEAVNKMRAERQQQQQAQMQMMAMQGGAETAKTLSETKMGEDNALSRMTQK